MKKKNNPINASESKPVAGSMDELARKFNSNEIEYNPKKDRRDSSQFFTIGPC
ncbi:hypothetical protein [Clostridium sp.]|uniref:hypothetical protein n=1 Tax=Clostridium sp. TaxID=1506 RepID=UPI003F66FAB2